MFDKDQAPGIRNPETLPAPKNDLEALKSGLTVAPVMAFLEKFDDFTKKKKKFLAGGDVLFDPGESPNFYIVASGAVKIFRINPTGDKKEVGKAFAGSCIGEGVLTGRLMKEVRAEAEVPTTVVVLTKADLDYLESLSPETLLGFYKHLNEISSRRLAETGKELALLYEATEKINSYKERGEKGFVDAVMLLKQTLSLEYVIAVEQHPVLPGLLVYKFNTRFPTVAINQRVGPELSVDDEGKTDRAGEILGTAEGDEIRILRLMSGEDLRGMLILGKRASKIGFTDYENRIAENLAPLFASMIEGNQRAADERARDRMNAY